MKSLIFRALSIVCLLSLGCYSHAQPCSHPNFRAFDFWIGDWEVSNAQGQVVGYNHIKVILDSCVIMENWTGAGGTSIGKSFNHYDVETKKWKQKWVDNFASNLEFTGTVEDGVATFFCPSINARTGARVYNKMVISKVSDDEVHQVWEQSSDTSEWTVVFDGTYRRMKEDKIHGVYAVFSECYVTKDARRLANLYTEDALYLSGNNAATRGREAIYKNFRGSFERMKERSQNAVIEFDIIDRRKSGNLVSDIGYYLLTYTFEDGRTEQHAGKFNTVLQQQKDGNWLFVSDTYNGAPVEAFGKK